MSSRSRAGSSGLLSTEAEFQPTNCLICNKEVIRGNNGRSASGSIPELTQGTVQSLFEVLEVKGLSAILEILRMDPGTLISFCPTCQTQVETYKAVEARVKELQAVGAEMKAGISKAFLRSSQGQDHDNAFPLLTATRKIITARENSYLL
jgi:endogenous inhibitor of DNA gyrase (YacG/DUF329 family)